MFRQANTRSCCRMLILLSGNKVYATGQKKPVIVSAKAGQKTTAPHLTIPGSPAPDLIPAKGILHDFTSASASEVDHFIETYQKYYGIPGVSLALIKDGQIGVSQNIRRSQYDDR